MKYRSVFALSLVAVILYLCVQAFLGGRIARTPTDPLRQRALLDSSTRLATPPEGAGDDEQASAGEVRGFQLPAQDLDLRLVGTEVANDPGKSLAILEEESTGKQRVCREGDRLGEILVKEILFGKVVIRTNAGDAVLSVGSRVAAGPLVRASQTAPQLARLDREEIDSALPDYAQLAREIRTRPRFEGGRPDGFVIYNIGPESILARLGLHDGDTIVGVNERPFSTTQPAVEFYDALKEGGIGSVEIKRDDGIRELLFEIR